jgi:hypothetical protein
MKLKKQKCEICDQMRVLTRFQICRECWKAQDHSYGNERFPRKEYIASHSLSDIQYAQAEDVSGLYSGRRLQEK